MAGLAQLHTPAGPQERNPALSSDTKTRRGLAELVVLNWPSLHSFSIVPLYRSATMGA